MQKHEQVRYALYFLCLVTTSNLSEIQHFLNIGQLKRIVKTSYGLMEYVLNQIHPEHLV